jgi:hypothetical protein
VDKGFRLADGLIIPAVLAEVLELEARVKD